MVVAQLTRNVDINARVHGFKFFIQEKKIIIIQLGSFEVLTQ